MIVSCKLDAVKNYINGGFFWWFKSLPWMAFVRLPPNLQLKLYRLAMHQKRYCLAWNLADHANCDYLDIDLMMTCAEIGEQINENR